MVVSTALVLATYVHPNLCRELGCCHHHPHNRGETCLLQIVCCELQINGENAEVGVSQGRARYIVAGPGNVTFTRTNAVEDDVQIVCRRWGAGPGILDGHGPVAASIQVVGVGVERVGVKSVDRGAPVARPRVGCTCANVIA